MKPLTQDHLRFFKTIIPADRLSTGVSVLDLHAKDQSMHPPSRPDVVIWPENPKEVSEILAYATRSGIPVTPWGSGTSLEGNPIPVKSGVVLDFARMNRIVEIRASDFQVDVEPGVVYQDLNDKLKYSGLFFPPDPGARATIGGMIANNASGTRTVYYGSTKDYVLKLSVVLAGGEIIEMGTRAAKSSSGYDLIHLFVGSEGTLGVVVAATLRLAGLPSEFSAAVVTFPALSNGGKAVFDIVRYGLNPAMLELLDTACVSLINREKRLGLPESPTLFIEYHGPTRQQLNDALDMTKNICEDAGSLEFRPGIGRAERDRLFEARHELGEIIKRSHPGCDTLVLDMGVPMSAYEEMVSVARENMAKAGVIGYLFSHAGDGNFHINLAGRKNDRQQWERIDEIVDRMVSAAIEMGGTATGEHGVGIGKRKFMAAEHGSSLKWMKQVKHLFDPTGILNPGKIFPS